MTVKDKYAKGYLNRMGRKLYWSISAEKRPLNWPNDNSWKHYKQLHESSASPTGQGRRGGQSSYSLLSGYDLYRRELLYLMEAVSTPTKT